MDSYPGVTCQYFYSSENSIREETTSSFGSRLYLGSAYVVKFGHANIEDRVTVLLSPSSYLIRALLSWFRVSISSLGGYAYQQFGCTLKFGNIS